MREKHASFLKRPPRYQCPFAECKCHRPGFRYEVHLDDHMRRCHTQYMLEDNAGPITGARCCGDYYFKWYEWERHQAEKHSGPPSWAEADRERTERLGASWNLDLHQVQAISPNDYDLMTRTRHVSSPASSDDSQHDPFHCRLLGPCAHMCLDYLPRPSTVPSRGPVLLLPLRTSTTGPFLPVCGPRPCSFILKWEICDPPIGHLLRSAFRNTWRMWWNTQLRHHR